VGKRPEDLPLDPTPISPAPEPQDARDTAAYRFIQDIDDLLNTGQYAWAERTLTDIQTTVERTGRVTEGQRRAIENIEAAVYKPRPRWRR
jgi:hypothetical protein